MSIAAKSNVTTASTGRGIFSIVGIACIVGFAIDMLVASFPLNPGALEWRVGFLR